jgi:ribonuclease HI
MRAHSLLAYVDGAARGNPGPAAAGIVLQDSEGRPVKTLSVAIGTATNNVAEYTALVLVLQEALLLGAKELEVFTDSELVAKQWSGEYKVKDPSLRVLHLLASHLKGGFTRLSVTHVPREKNKLADDAANRALDSTALF